MPCFMGLISSLMGHGLTERKEVRKQTAFPCSVSRELEAVLTTIHSTNSWQIAKYSIRPINASLASVLHEIQFSSTVCLVVRFHAAPAPSSIRP